MGRLQELSLRKSYKVTDSGVAALAAQRSLVKLVLNCVPALTDATVKALVASCRCLHCFLPSASGQAQRMPLQAWTTASWSGWP